MSANTRIEWTELTWNPTTGCDRVSAGCDNCYALTMAKRLKAMGSAKYQTDGDPRTSGPGFGVAMHDEALRLPLGRKKPTRIFVDSMSDLFHHKVSEQFIARVFAVMAATPDHTYQVLTKRPGRMRALLSRGELGTEGFPDMVEEAMAEFTHAGLDVWPLPNVWLGTSVENQRQANVRIGHLLKTLAAKRWLSCEPLLGPLDLDGPVVNGHRPRLTYWLTGRPGWGQEQTTPTGMVMQELVTGPRVDWVVVGGESGPGARPMDPQWARRLRDQCVAAGVPFLFKQWGEWAPRCTLALCGQRCSCAGTNASHPFEMHRFGKKAAGRLLDDREWTEYPPCRT